MLCESDVSNGKEDEINIHSHACFVLPYRCSLSLSFACPHTHQRLSAQIAVSASDTEDMIQQQWLTLCSHLTMPNVCLLIHLKNHYALVFACRHYYRQQENGGGFAIVREILSARRGQRPSSWISFDEWRRMVLSWDGHRILKISRKELKR